MFLRRPWRRRWSDETRNVDRASGAGGYGHRHRKFRRCFKALGTITGMPKAAIGRNGIDFVLNLVEIGLLVAKLVSVA